MKFRIKADYAARIQPFTSKEETRFYLRGFYVEPAETGVVIIATNGHILGVFNDPDGSCEEPGNCILNRYVIAACRPAIPSEFAGDRWLVVDDDRAEVRELAYPLAYQRSENPETIIAAQTLRSIDAVFPDWRFVVPKQIPDSYHMPGAFNPRLLADIARAIGSHHSIRLLASDSASPALVLTDRKDFVGVIMPLRASDELPGWFSKCLEQRAKKPD